MIRWHQPMGERGLLGRFADTFLLWTGMYVIFGVLLLGNVLDASATAQGSASFVLLVIAIRMELVDIRSYKRRGEPWSIPEGEATNTNATSSAVRFHENVTPEQVRK